MKTLCTFRFSFIFLLAMHCGLAASDRPSQSTYWQRPQDFVTNYWKSLAFGGLGLGFGYSALYKFDDSRLRAVAAVSAFPAFWASYWYALKQRKVLEEQQKQSLQSSIFIKKEENRNVEEEKEEEDEGEESGLPSITYEELVKNSIAFNNTVCPFPTQNNKIEAIVGSRHITGTEEEKKETIADHANRTWPIAHAKVFDLIQKFVVYKVKHGSDIEKAFYKRNMFYKRNIMSEGNVNVSAFVTRLLTKRPLEFLGEKDGHILREEGGKNRSIDTKKGYTFDNIGTPDQQEPLVLKDYISYDEMQISALLGVSTPTFFINDGERTNEAKIGVKGSFQEQGVYVGLVGARFERTELTLSPRMEFQHMVIEEKQNTKENGYGSRKGSNTLLNIWQELYDETFPTYNQAQGDTSGRYIPVSFKRYLDSNVYIKRMKMVIEPFLHDANKRGEVARKNVYCFAVGLGLGAWQIDDCQRELYVRAFQEIIQSNKFPSISDIDFSWIDFDYRFNEATFKDERTSMYKDINKVEKPFVSDKLKKSIVSTAIKEQINVQFTNHNPARKLKGTDENKLLVPMYAWDSNAFTGNEYWAKRLAMSGDPAAAACSTIPELQNPLINPAVSGDRTAYYGGALVKKEEEE